MIRETHHQHLPENRVRRCSLAVAGKEVAEVAFPLLRHPKGLAMLLVVGLARTRKARKEAHNSIPNALDKSPGVLGHAEFSARGPPSYPFRLAGVTGKGFERG